MKRTRFRIILAWLMALALIVGLLPGAVLASGSTAAFSITTSLYDAGIKGNSFWLHTAAGRFVQLEYILGGAYSAELQPGEYYFLLYI